MRVLKSRGSNAGAMTIVEMSATLALMIALAGITAYSIGGFREWKLARESSATLQSVYVAQKAWLADHPTSAINTITEADLLPYMSGDLTALPEVEKLDGAMVEIIVNQVPPVISGSYDPSDSTTDGLWDVGKP